MSVASMGLAVFGRGARGVPERPGAISEEDSLILFTAFFEAVAAFLGVLVLSPYILSGAAVIFSRVLPVTADLSFSVISAALAYLSLCLISSQALSSPVRVCTNANSPFSFFPWRENLREPAFSSFKSN